MSNRVHIICHPMAGKGKGKKAWQEVTDVLDSFQIDYLTYQTSHQTHARLIVQKLVNRTVDDTIEHLVVIGGDGTLHEVVSELVKYKQTIPITYIAAGSGADFARVWYPDQNIRQTIEGMVYGRKPISVPVFTYTNSLTGEDGVILNSMGFGFDAQVNFKHDQLSDSIGKMSLNSFLYKVAVALALPQVPHFSARIIMDGEIVDFADTSMLIVAKNPYLGGGLMIDNLSSPTSKELAVVVYHDVDKSGIRDIIPRVLKTNDHDQSDYITRLTGDQLQVQIDDPVRSQVDGEDLAVNQADYTFGVSSYPFLAAFKEPTYDDL